MSEREEIDGMARYVHAINNPSRDDPAWPLPSFDARDWAKAFCAIHPGHDEGLMLTWFANALMRGYDEHAQRASGALTKRDAQIAALLKVKRAAIIFGIIGEVRDVPPYTERDDNLSAYSGLASPSEGDFRRIRSVLAAYAAWERDNA